MSKKTLNLRDVEDQIWNLEGIRVVFRAPATLAPSHATGYDYVKRMKETSTIHHLYDRLKAIGLGDIPVLIFDRKGQPLPASYTNAAWSIRKLSVNEVYDA